MNKEIYNLLKKNDIKPLGYKKDKSSLIISTKQKNFVLKEKKDNQEEIFNYLKIRNFNFFPEYYNLGKYQMFEYLNDNPISNYNRGEEIINLVSLLHNKTTVYEDIDVDDYKKNYEDLNIKIDDLISYYNNLNDLIDKSIYMSPSNYLLVRNISKIYASLDFCKKGLDEWYKLIKDNPKRRKVLIHNNLKLDNLIRDDDSYLISWDKAKYDIPIYDIYNFYKNSYRDVPFTDLYNLYEAKYKLHEDERILLFVLISIPEKIIYSKDELTNTKNTKHLLDYLLKTEKIILQYYSNEQKEENSNFSK